MWHVRTTRLWAIGFSLLIAACTQATGALSPLPRSPASTPADPLVEVGAALRASGVTIVAALETTASDATFSCLPGSMRTFAFDLEAPHPTFRPGEKPPIKALAFVSSADRQAAQRQISGDGTQINGPRCGALIDWVAPPHWAGGGRYLLLVVSVDGTLAAQVAAAAARLGSP